MSPNRKYETPLSQPRPAGNDSRDQQGKAPSNREYWRRLFHSSQYREQDGLDDYSIRCSPWKQQAHQFKAPSSQAKHPGLNRNPETSRLAAEPADNAPEPDQTAERKGSTGIERRERASIAACAHTSCMRTGCTRCLDLCSSGALSSQEGRIVFQASLCRSCGGCLLACPTEAAASRRSERSSALEHLAPRLQSHLASGQPPPGLILYTGHPPLSSPELDGQGFAMAISIDSSATRGLELWFGALALGAASVSIALGEPTPEPVLEEYRRLELLAGQILESLGLDPERIRVVAPGEPLPPAPRDPQAADSPSSKGLWGASKRELLVESLRRLGSGSSLPRAIELPLDSCFGTVRIDPERCTLCLACATICPTGAMQAQASSWTELLFLELDCVQCGLCREACPEAALQLEPRLLLTDEAFSLRRLQGEEMELCPQCGEPVASKSLLQGIEARLKGHWMFQEQSARNRFFLCADCKARAALKE